MKTTVREERLLVISDIHMGNPMHRPRQSFYDLVRFALEHRYSLVLNGDGIDIAQLSLTRLTDDLTPSLGILSRFMEAGQRIYYTVGNHDIALENFLNDLGWMKVVPFLNVYSGDKRIRVEHGHTYDGMFLRYPRTYTVFTAIGRMAIWVSPKFYDFIHHINLMIIKFVEWMIGGFGRKKAAEPVEENRIKGERKCFGDGAEDVGQHGFDAVVFGHTHLPGEIQFNEGLRYYNTGGWFTNAHAFIVADGRIWFGSVPQLMQQGDPFPRPDETELFVTPAALAIA